MLIGCAVEPMPLAPNVDAGLISVNQLCCRQTVFNPMFEPLGLLERFLVEVEQRSGAQGEADLIFKILAYTLIRQPLVQRQIDGVRFQSGAILHGAINPGGKRCHDPVALFVFQYLGLILRDEAADIQLKHLAPFISDRPECTAFGQGASINLDRFDLIRIGDLLQGLPTRPGCPPGLRSPVLRRVLGRFGSCDGGLLLLRLLVLSRPVRS